jgi:hypothetical protein
MGRGKVSESTVSLANVRAYGRGWSKQELAHFHRVFNALWEAGLSLETDSGVTDESEPWFVFCDADSGAVVAHFARLSGKFAVYAPFLNGTLTGHVFLDLVERFLDRCPGRRVASFSSHSPPAA